MSQQAPNPAEAYERVIAQQVFVPWTQEMIKRAGIKGGESVLDLACGTGIVTRQIASLVGASGSITGLDIAAPMLEIARKLVPTDGPAIELREGSGTDMPFDDGSFDLVLCQQGLQFFPDPAAGLREIHRVLKPGGRAVVTTWRPLAEFRFMEVMEALVTKHFMPGAMSVGTSLGDDRLVTQMANDAGFAQVEVQQQSLEIRVPEPVRFATMVLQGAAAVLPEFMKLSPEERQALLGRMQADIGEAIQQFVDGDIAVMDSRVNILVARR